jgi:hypothetical protein
VPVGQPLGRTRSGFLNLSAADLVAEVQSTRPVTFDLSVFRGIINDEEWLPVSGAELLAWIE